MKRRWIRNRDGLFVPKSTTPRLDPQDRNTEQRRFLREIRGEYFQGWAALLLLLLSIPGIMISYSALTDQRRTNRSELESYDQERERKQRRNASQFGWLGPRGDAPIVLGIENRSSVTVSNAILVNDLKTHALVFGSVAACSSIVVDLRPLQESPQNTAQLTEWHSWATGTLYFGDPAGTWVRGGDGLSAGAPPSLDLLAFARVFSVLRTAALVTLEPDSAFVQRCILLRTEFQSPLASCIGE
jgi:hypothetical protein